uniref:TlyA family RNA methyltransferase n=1 Tax=candidate division CPR3 bacterium TaxID=2268181 RepID=A0A7C4LZU0_UNCC3
MCYNIIMEKRLDILVHNKGLAESREKAQRLIMAGKIKVGDRIEIKPGMKYKEDAKIEALEQDPYVGRGAYKMKGAKEDFEIDFKEKIIADIGSSTGGFTDYALQNGAKKVYAIDVGTGQLDWKLRNDQRVVVMEKTNFRDINSFPEKVDLVMIDVSFVSVKRILKKIYEMEKIILKPESKIIALFKPQFEVEKELADKFKGIIKDDDIRQKIFVQFREWCAQNQFEILNEKDSAIKGDKGNLERFFYIKLK